MQSRPRSRIAVKVVKSNTRPLRILECPPLYNTRPSAPAMPRARVRAACLTKSRKGTGSLYPVTSAASPAFEVSVCVLT